MSPCCLPRIAQQRLDLQDSQMAESTKGQVVMCKGHLSIRRDVLTSESRGASYLSPSFKALGHTYRPRIAVTAKKEEETWMHELDLVVFDMVGTTVRATNQVPAAFQETFEQVGVILSDEEIQSVRGRSKREAISDLLTHHLSAADERRLATGVYNDFQRILIKRYEEHGVEPVDGADETFEWLRKHDVKVALSTGFDRALADLLLQMIGWDKSIDAVVCNEDVHRGRPAPYLVFRAMEWTGCECVRRVAVVGDTVSDLQAASNAGARWSIAVLSGAHSESQLKSCPHSEIIASVRELPFVFK